MADNRNDDSAPFEQDLQSLEQQLELGAMQTHSVLSRFAERINRMEALLYGVADTLMQGGVIGEEALREQTRRAGQELADRGETLDGGVALRVDSDVEAPAVDVDCAARWHVCEAICCRLSFALTPEEVESGKLKWEIGRPYFIRQGQDGACVHRDAATHHCTVREHRPRVCQRYSCASDGRIWADFDNMVLNREWLDKHLSAQRPRLIRIQMHPSKRPAPATTDGGEP